MNVDEILNLMDEMLENSARVPLSGGKRVVDVDHMTQMIDDIRATMPNEIKQARMIVSDRSDIISNARQEADRLIKKAEEKAAQMVAEDEITQRAKAQAKEIVGQAQSRCSDQMRAAAEFSDKLIAYTEETLLNSLKAVKEAKETMHRSRHASPTPAKEASVDIQVD